MCNARWIISEHRCGGGGGYVEQVNVFRIENGGERGLKRVSLREHSCSLTLRNHVFERGAARSFACRIGCVPEMCAAGLRERGRGLYPCFVS